MPRIGGAEHLWMNGLYEAFCIIIVFPLIVYIGASGVVHNQTEDKICKFLGNLSYPLYTIHYVLVYFYVAWVSNHSGITLWQAWPYALLTFSGTIVLAYASLKLYDEPVRAWLRKKLKQRKGKYIIYFFFNIFLWFSSFILRGFSIAVS